MGNYRFKMKKSLRVCFIVIFLLIGILVKFLCANNKKEPIIIGFSAQLTGGQAVEGMEIEEAYNITNKSESYTQFRAKYKARFGNEATFGSAYSYEATLILAEALKRTNGSKDGLKQSLLETRDFTGLIDKISIDKFGDVERSYYISIINEGKFKIIHEFTSANTGGN